jgi:hypothetical protein
MPVFKALIVTSTPFKRVFDLIAPAIVMYAHGPHQPRVRTPTFSRRHSTASKRCLKFLVHAFIAVYDLSVGIASYFIAVPLPNVNSRGWRSVRKLF